MARKVILNLTSLSHEAFSVENEKYVQNLSTAHLMVHMNQKHLNQPTAKATQALNTYSTLWFQRSWVYFTSNCMFSLKFIPGLLWGADDTPLSSHLTKANSHRGYPKPFPPYLGWEFSSYIRSFPSLKRLMVCLVFFIRFSMKTRKYSFSPRVSIFPS